MAHALSALAVACMLLGAAPADAKVVTVRIEGLDFSPKEITVEVSTDGSGPQGVSPGGSGRGLDGLRRRVDVLGGDFSAGRRTDGGFVVRARIPAGSPS